VSPLGLQQKQISFEANTNRMLLGSGSDFSIFKLSKFNLNVESAF
jgi:hypothetical protein